MRSWIPFPLRNNKKIDRSLRGKSFSSAEGSSPLLPLARLLARGTVLRTVIMFFAAHARGAVAIGFHQKPRLGGDGDGILFEVFHAVCFAVCAPFTAIDETTFGLGVVNEKRGKEACAASPYTSKMA